VRLTTRKLLIGAILGAFVAAGGLTHARATTLTAGDTTPISLTATSGGSAYDLTGALFETYIKGVRSNRVIPNSQHSITSAVAGTFTVQLTSSDYDAIGTGTLKDIVTKVTQGTNVTYFRGVGVLNIFPNRPLK
jgi:hypothetical protein